MSNKSNFFFCEILKITYKLYPMIYPDCSTDPDYWGHCNIISDQDKSYKKLILDK